MAANLGTDWGLIISSITLTFVAIGSFIGLYKWCCHKRRFKDPIELRYLIPKRQYPEADFIDAPEEEKKPISLTVGIGDYRLMHVITPKIDMLIDAIVLRFEGDNKNKPKRHGADNPFMVKRIDKPNGVYYLDWWGDVQPASTTFPRYLHLGDTLVVGNRIETIGNWQGKVYFEFPIRNERVIIKKLDFKVTENAKEDEIPFLKVDVSEKD